VDLRFAESNKAIEKAQQALLHRLEGMNEFREQLRAQGSTFATCNDLERLREQVQEHQYQVHRVLI
jgi:hypothetical protein